MSGWERTHRRYRLVYAVAEDIARRGPGARYDWQSEIDAEYGGIQEFLLDVRRRWRTAVDAHLDDLGTQHLAEVEAAVAADNRPLLVLLDTFVHHRTPAGVPEAV